MTKQNIPQPSPAATVILIDDNRPWATGGGKTFSLYIMERAAKSSFMPGRFVFPGGTLEPWDGTAPGSGDSPALRTCALRETFEEAGVLLVKEKDRAAELDRGLIEKTRRQVHRGQTDLAVILKKLDLTPDPESLIPFAHWITPVGRPRRFDAVFYLAVMPKGQEAVCDFEETSRGLWLTPEKALAENAAGRTVLAPPQVRLTGELAGFDSAEELFQAAVAKKVKTIMPLMWAKDKERMILMPWDTDFSRAEPRTAALPCPAGASSRLVFSGSRWLPFSTATTHNNGCPVQLS